MFLIFSIPCSVYNRRTGSLCKEKIKTKQKTSNSLFSLFSLLLLWIHGVPFTGSVAPETCCHLQSQPHIHSKPITSCQFSTWVFPISTYFLAIVPPLPGFHLPSKFPRLAPSHLSLIHSKICFLLRSV